MKSERWTAVEYEREIKGIHNIIKSTHIEQPYNAMLHFEYEKENEKKRTQIKAFTHSWRCCMAGTTMKRIENEKEKQREKSERDRISPHFT